MSTSFKKPANAPELLASEPQKSHHPAVAVQPGLEHRPFSDDEIKEAFQTFDLDSNRFVGAAEIAHILKIIGEEVTDEEIDEMIRMCDSDGDGQVTFDEFYKMMTTPPPPLPPAAVQRKAKTKGVQSGGAKKYAKSITGGPSDSLGAADIAQNKGNWKAQQKAASNASEQAQAMRSMSVEMLIKKLSGGMGKIKPSQIKKIYKRFQDIDIDKSGAIDYEEFIQAMEMDDSVMAGQMFRVFDMDGSGSIELKEFIVVLSRYTSAAKSEKLKFAFMMFDEDGSSLIERRELIEMLRASFVVEGYSSEELEERADRVFDFLNLPRDGAIGYEDFLKLATAKNGLVYPVEEERHTLGKESAIDKLVNK
ncbi:unnamed protein product [Polarella glacialis]|uniref:EF-hand domain-containing protein n=1 Tax=Polarella glacialis TaxID=89957 RepID=A0A813F2N6_POLGL|nr:unnamed protein product [Polarella glacialis]|mmetsp:Transcript_57071/g.92446  ORF Transcript_57071/g.92446 Transcript_57071/m.92446 type:complete len:364 (-) Transcript_57071:109-1200(-)|eukprot:CAMPEP_0115060520 /NCGR_PEP_ID=MMETSP0227-20121206/7506_1 /TAXON_ID=89957 /ORGANISM="Polarella glacialis, Strain CCMP 1383" /LENGTH=363 /DNA_ID=CAMNT_0002445737 /DNA_START=83 /DNA_END=1174 /DNA_ORIENTATION=+